MLNSQPADRERSGQRNRAGAGEREFARRRGSRGRPLRLDALLHRFPFRALSLRQRELTEPFYSNFPQWSNYDRTRNQFFTLGQKHIFSNKLINSANLGVSRTFLDLHSDGTAGDLLDFSGDLTTARGEPIMDGALSAGSTSPPLVRGKSSGSIRQNKLSVGDDIFWTKGEHSFRFGGNVERVQTNACTCFRAAEMDFHLVGVVPDGLSPGLQGSLQLQQQRARLRLLEWQPLSGTFRAARCARNRLFHVCARRLEGSADRHSISDCVTRRPQTRVMHSTSCMTCFPCHLGRRETFPLQRDRRPHPPSRPCPTTC